MAVTQVTAFFIYFAISKEGKISCVAYRWHSQYRSIKEYRFCSEKISFNGIPNGYKNLKCKIQNASKQSLCLADAIHLPLHKEGYTSSVGRAATFPSWGRLHFCICLGILLVQGSRCRTYDTCAFTPTYLQFYFYSLH